ncbi:protein translocase subunit secY/sec61 alpha [Anseongella ginsenosidimutans]|uniref:Protein translocase subunit SecY n=1 Tax=Anseongella ginsenosidimutans TaxID=496056 RepID=A0A4R3KNB1_9SPHI|nr:preprotein translocase subunit SecY [Anseongella ginsenosidimutans]QEC54040.1 preprotein translocase subunit SecY [Anseongella ginsenosidimutans]TCS85195.1 protein translocase subunit secY/sec61 alpha [Anseongella ginsenosidimutans]
MKKLIDTLVNIWKIEDLRTRILNTIMFLAIYRLGSYVVLPGVNPAILNQSFDQSGLLGLLNMFAGGAFANASVMALGVMPYISASIVIQLLTVAVPYFQKLQKEGESGRKKINQITRYLTIIITAGQAMAFIKAQVPANAIMVNMTLFTVSSVVILTAGTMFVMWLGEKITDKGIGNGISLIIMIGIIAWLPQALIQESVAKFESGGGGLIALIVEMVALAVVVMFTILLVQGVRRIPVQYAKRIVGNKQYGGVRQYIPLKVNAAGVMPIIFAQAIMFIPATVGQIFPSAAESGFWSSFNDYTSVSYNVTFAILIILFTYFYTAITVNPMQMAEDMKKNGGFVPGVKPGRATADFIDTIMSRITLPGSVFLALIAILPAIAVQVGVSSQFAQFYGGTSLLIMVGVVLDTLQQIESHLLMRHYDGLMKTGRIKGRAAVGASI